MRSHKQLEQTTSKNNSLGLVITETHNQTGSRQAGEGLNSTHPHALLVRGATQLPIVQPRPQGLGQLHRGQVPSMKHTNHYLHGSSAPPRLEGPQGQGSCGTCGYDGADAGPARILQEPVRECEHTMETLVGR